MKKKIEIHIAKHKETGANIPIIVKKVNDKCEIEDYEEFKKNRKGFTLSMLIRRWDKDKEDILTILHEYQVPAHINYKDFRNIVTDENPINYAFFFEEYILSIEKKLNLPHKKVKSHLYKDKE